MSSSPTDSLEESSAPASRAVEGFAEDIHGLCTCDPSVPKHDCFWCHGTGYRLEKRIIRPANHSEQAAAAIIRTMQAALVKGANTLDQAAVLLLKAGAPTESAHTKRAAEAMRLAAQG